MTSPPVPETVWCSYCSEQFPDDEPMVDYDGQTFCSPACVQEMLNNDEPMDHAAWAGAVRRFNNRLTRILDQGATL